MLLGKTPLFLLTSLALLTGCDSSSRLSQQNGELDFQAPEKIRTSLAVDFDQVSGIANVNDRVFEMQRMGERFIATVPGVPANSTVSIDLRFIETLPSGAALDLARTEPQTFTVGSTDQTIEIFEEQFSYDFDDDNDGISNIGERNDGTDPFVPESAGIRAVTVNFNIPLRADPTITQVAVLIADAPRQFMRDGAFRTATGLVSTLNTIEVDVRLTRNITVQGQQRIVLLADSVTTVVAGSQDFTLNLNDTDFDFNIDTDGDGIINIDELQAGTDPFIAG